MYNDPSFTLARTIGGLMNWYWRIRLGRQDTPLIVLASVSLITPCPPARPPRCQIDPPKQISYTTVITATSFRKKKSRLCFCT